MDFTEVRKEGLIESLSRQYKLLNEYERVRDLSTDAKEIARANEEIIEIRKSLMRYIEEYKLLCCKGKSDIPKEFLSISSKLQFLDETQEIINNNKDLNTITRILFLSSSPANQSRLRVDQEAREIQEKLQLAKMRGHFEIHIRMATRPEDLIQALLDTEPRIVHFSGHGSSEGELYLEDKLGNSHPVEPDTLAALLKLVSDKVECVLLNACFSEIQANAICKHIPYVIGMNQAISDNAAIAFSVGFYQAIGAGKSIDQAYEFGVVQIRLQGIPEYLKPI